MSPGTAVQVNPLSRYRELLGPQGVLTDPDSCRRYAIDNVVPKVVVVPEDAEQVAAVLRVATEQQWSVVPYGGGTRQSAGESPSEIHVVLSTAKMQTITCYDPGDLTIEVQAGAQGAAVAKGCSAHMQLLALQAPAGATIGGALAANDSGPLRTGFGSARDICIGIRFITGDGASGRGGGRVVKNVAGYDLMKLMIGSYGTLGVIVSANFKLFPLPQNTMTALCAFASLGEAMQLRDMLLRSPLGPVAAELLSPYSQQYLSDVPPRDGEEWISQESAAHVPTWTLALRFAGSDRVLARCRAELGSTITQEVSGPPELELWRKIDHLESRVLARHPNATVFQVELPIADSHNALVGAEAAAQANNSIPIILGRVLVGSYLCIFAPFAAESAVATGYAELASDFRSRLSPQTTSAVVRCPMEAKAHFDLWGSTPTDTLLMRKIKHAMDPAGVLNRGRFLFV